MRGVALSLVTLLAATVALAQGRWIASEVAVLQALDKVTARTTVLEAKRGERVSFGTLEIVVEACHRRPPDEQPDAAAWLRVVDRRLGPEPVFAGWIFAAAPAVNMLEHAVYDLRVLACR
ncbi:DUF2155 domain-containing protein [Elioraea thermophila]|uniref:DUF2155 domain-containing protein n=1 Tax=Elioraea thermophila TaxID=2185104 RepID=UPI000DF4B92A|nr:DUF2155 domain-containing protein [Elioraea thermophila]